MKLRVCIAGATGWVGKPVCAAVAKASDMSLVGAVSPSHKGQRLGDIIGEPDLRLIISGSVSEALKVPAVDQNSLLRRRKNLLLKLRGSHMTLIFRSLSLRRNKGRR